MGLLCAVFETFRNILKQSFPMYHRHNQNSLGFNPIYQAIAVNESLSNMLIPNLWDYAAYQRKCACAPRNR